MVVTYPSTLPGSGSCSIGSSTPGWDTYVYEHMSENHIYIYP